MSEGKRYDQGKNRLDLHSIPALWAVGMVSTMGSVKYEDRNWEKGMSFSRTLGCALRHIFKWAVGHKHDEESGLHHLAHAAWNILALLHFELHPEKYKEFDDLPDYRSSVPNESCPGGDRPAPEPTLSMSQLKTLLSLKTTEGSLSRKAQDILMEVARNVLRAEPNQ